MDTPGLEDSRGLEQDEKNIDSILKTASKTPELNAIIIVINGTNPRITGRVKYVVQKLKGIIPNVIKENLLILQSNVACKTNPPINDLEMGV